MSGYTASGFAPIALVGSGEFLPQMIGVDRWLLDGRPPRAAFLPTAAGEESAASVKRWLTLGRNHYARMGIEPVEVPVLNRKQADDPALAELINNVGLIYLSGGNPGYVAATLRDTLVWRTIVDAWKNGTALAGCSAGAMALSAMAPSVRGRTINSEPGLGLISHLSVLPHFDQMGKWDPGFLDRAIERRQPGTTIVGIDEDTALVGGPSEWTVMGRQTVTVFSADGPIKYVADDTIMLSSPE
jgi:cyanophycinase